MSPTNLVPSLASPKTPLYKGSSYQYKPTLILHGGAGTITRTSLPPALYKSYRTSLLTYLASTHSLLLAETSALDAACHAVSLLEDDPLFNCGRGSVFTSDGEIEMEASLMICSASPRGAPVEWGVKRAVGVSLIKETRHPILLAKEVLLEGGDGRGGTGTMHCQRSGGEMEEWGWREKGLERKGREWFWTRKRWEEHLRHGEGDGRTLPWGEGEEVVPSQGTVGAVCMDCYGNLAVATSTGGLTNKKPGRIGDTPSVGAGFWAESWVDEYMVRQEYGLSLGTRTLYTTSLTELLQSVTGCVIGYVEGCLPQLSDKPYSRVYSKAVEKPTRPIRRAVAISGTGNGDSFIRLNAVRTAAAMCRFLGYGLQRGFDQVAGPGGELQQSAGDRFGETGEGEGGMIGVQLHKDGSGQVCFAFNCQGMFRAWVDRTGTARMMVFHDEY